MGNTFTETNRWFGFLLQFKTSIVINGVRDGADVWDTEIFQRLEVVWSIQPLKEMMATDVSRGVKTADV